MYLFKVYIMHKNINIEGSMKVVHLSSNLSETSQIIFKFLWEMEEK